MTASNDSAASFERFARVEGLRLRRVLSAQHGIDIGSDACAAALAWGWENWERVLAMANPAGYLYRVAQTHARRERENGRTVSLPDEAASYEDEPDMFDDSLSTALLQLTEPQRVAVLMVHAYGWTPTEVAVVIGARPATVRSHLRRGLRRLRTLVPESVAS